MFTLLTSSAKNSTVTASAAALSTTLAAKQAYQYVASTNSWVKQGTAIKITCVSKANLVDGDFLTLSVSPGPKVYEFDVNGTGVTAGWVQVDVSGDSSAATVAARLKTAIDGAQPQLTVVDNTDGSITVFAPDLLLVVVENVANVNFTRADAIMNVTAGAGSLFVPTGVPVLFGGNQGPHVGVLRDSADGKASLVQCQVV